jgi:glycolate oxidase iron-sulfur subunit
MGNLLDTQTVEAACTLLSAVGTSPIIHSQQRCCGALALHQGEYHTAQKLAGHNIRAFNLSQPIVYLATGCGTLLQEYSTLMQDTDSSTTAHAFSERAIEICTYLARHPHLSQLQFRPFNKRVAVHIPCSLRNTLKGEKALMTVLRSVPGAHLVPLASNDTCCGASGSYMLTQPEISHTLLKIKLDDIESIQPDLILSSNIGCLLHIQAGLKAKGSPIQVIHPVEWLGRQLVY